MDIRIRERNTSRVRARVAGNNVFSMLQVFFWCSLLGINYIPGFGVAEKANDDVRRRKGRPIFSNESIVGEHGIIQGKSSSCATAQNIHGVSQSAYVQNSHTTNPSFTPTMAFTFPLITLEEHFASSAVAAQYDAAGEASAYAMFPKPVQEKLMDLGSVRLAAMDREAVTVQVISHAPNRLALTPETCVKTNDELFAAKQKHPDHFAAFATLPMAYPAEAANELRRCVRELGFVGSLVDNNTNGRFYDDPFFWPIFEAHVELDVPCYIHPTYHYDAMDVLYRGNYPEQIAESLALHGFGWHSECALHMLRLFAAKCFDAYPKLKIIIGHMSEMLPFQLDRICRLSETQWPAFGYMPERKLMEVWNENIWITTSGLFTLAPMACLVRMCKLECILYSVDWPFAENEMGLAFMKEFVNDGMVTEEQVELIAYKNAEKLLKIKAK
jgi:predicted TIM-barrel fold metal-dependent hydrolase